MATKSPSAATWSLEEKLRVLNFSMAQGELDPVELREAWDRAVACPGVEVEVGTSGRTIAVFDGGTRIDTR